MDWLLAGPSAPFGEGEMFHCELAPPPLPPYCQLHELGPCPAHTGAPPRLPSPTPSNELPEYSFPPRYGRIPDLPSPTPPAAETGSYPSVPDLNLVIKMEEEEIEGHGSSSTLSPPPSSAALTLPPTPPPEAHRILRQFAAAMAQNCAAVRGAWSSAAASPTPLGRAAAVGTVRRRGDVPASLKDEAMGRRALEW
ncbi:hypothetical protein ZWY2020_040858 [Hordeum vulgare]|nr:hypothetical protein ZWY2020_040858 [Hordeum vulgare]